MSIRRPTGLYQTSQTAGPISKRRTPRVACTGMINICCNDRVRMCSARVVQVHVGTGPTRKSFGIHAPFLYVRSKYFQALLDGDWLETANGDITLKDDDPVVFNMFTNWLYHQEIAPAFEISKISTYMILDLALYADFREIPGLHNAAIDALAKRCATNYIELEDFRNVWHQTPSGSLLRKFLVDMMVLSGKAKKIVQAQSYQITKELLQELAIALLEDKEDAKAKDTSSPWDRRAEPRLNYIRSIQTWQRHFLSR